MNTIKPAKQKAEHTILFHEQIVTEMCDKYHLIEDKVYFPNMNAIFELGGSLNIKDWFDF